MAKEKGKTVIDESAEKFVKVTREDQAAGRVLTAVERGVYQLPGNCAYEGDGGGGGRAGEMVQPPVR